MSWRMAVGLVSAATVLALIVAYRWFNTGPRASRRSSIAMLPPAWPVRPRRRSSPKPTSFPCPNPFNAIDGHATMQVKLLGAIPMVDARGPEMDRAETVTLFNDMCLLAPGTLLGPGITWQPRDARSADALFTYAGQTISATLIFGDDGRLANFVSDDRSRSSPDGQSFTPLRFSTPVRDYRAFGPLWLAGHGDAQWLLPTGEFVYGEFDMLESAMDPRPR